ncbi:hypothetical protein ACEPAF_9963 [Sanghuangporus sanghuang]
MSVQPITFIETFSGRDGETVEGWIEDVDSVFWLMQIPEEKRVPLVVKRCLSCGVLECLLSVIISVEKISGRRWEWDWSKMKVALRGIERQINSNKPSGNGGSWMKALTFGAIVAVGGPLGLGWALTETAICTLAVVAWNKVDTTDVKAEAIASEVGKGKLPPGARETIRQIWSKPPSKSWKDGYKFNPSRELAIELLRMISPGKNISQRKEAKCFSTQRAPRHPISCTSLCSRFPLYYYLCNNQKRSFLQSKHYLSCKAESEIGFF